MLSRMSSVYPRMALSGVRSSWLMLARNCDLCLLASASSRLFSSISRNSRAFWIARTDWSAKVSSRSTVLLGNSPGCLRRTTSMPTISPADDDIEYRGRARLIQQVGNLYGGALRGRLRYSFLCINALVSYRGDH